MEQSLLNNEENEILEYFEDCLWKKAENQYNFYLDREKKWKNETVYEGYKLLVELLRVTRSILQYTRNVMVEKGLDEERIIKEGYDIYSKKDSRNVLGTWSQSQYHHLGLQYNYIRYKSMQRFTEIYNLLQRVYNVGVFKNIQEKSKIRIISLGGGPGFELYASKIFFSGKINCEVTSLDLENEWEIYAKKIGCDFIHADLHDPKIYSIITDNYDYVILSYIVGQHLKDSNLIFNLITKCNLKAIFVNSGFEILNIYDKLEKIDIGVIRLLPQNYGRDDRQVVLINNSDIKQTVKELNRFDVYEVLYPNIPYNEHKAESEQGLECKSGRFCRNKSDCKLLHPLSKKKKCKYGEDCINRFCYFKH